MCRVALILALFVSCAPCRAQEIARNEPEPPIEFPSADEPAPVDHLHLQADYLYWYLRRLRVPPLLTAGPVGSSGILGDQGVSVLRGGDRLESRHDRYVGLRSIADWCFADE